MARHLVNKIEDSNERKEITAENTESARLDAIRLSILERSLSGRLFTQLKGLDPLSTTGLLRGLDKYEVTLLIPSQSLAMPRGKVWSYGED
ncbi:hypothetical protein J6590_061165 [Homalodisca vitripennis]|nr:hypothetical protein J6590_061165 [Homalodisca vitripennis]